MIPSPYNHTSLTFGKEKVFLKELPQDAIPVSSLKKASRLRLPGLPRCLRWLLGGLFQQLRGAEVSQTAKPVQTSLKAEGSTAGEPNTEPVRLPPPSPASQRPPRPRYRGEWWRSFGFPQRLGAGGLPEARAGVTSPERSLPPPTRVTREASQKGPAAPAVTPPVRGSLAPSRALLPWGGSASRPPSPHRPIPPRPRKGAAGAGRPPATPRRSRDESAPPPPAGGPPGRPGAEQWDVSPEEGDTRDFPPAWGGGRGAGPRLTGRRRRGPRGAATRPLRQRLRRAPRPAPPGQAPAGGRGGRDSLAGAGPASPDSQR